MLPSECRVPIAGLPQHREPSIAISPPSLARRIAAQAWPVLLGQCSAMAYGVVDTMMTGHASPTDLAAMGLGASVYGTVFVGLMGVRP